MESEWGLLLRGAVKISRGDWASIPSLEGRLITCSQVSTSKVIFSERLKSLMKARNLTQQQLAGAVGVSQPAVAKWLSGSAPRVGVLFRLAKFFGEPFESLLQAIPYNPKAGSRDRFNKSTVEMDADQIEPESRKDVDNFLNVVNDPEKMAALLEWLNNLTKVTNTVTSAGVKAKLSVPNIMRRAAKFLDAPGSKVALARELGVPRSRISDWLSGRRVPDGSTMIALYNWVLERESEK